MEGSLVRIGIVGASSLLGKELAEELANSAFAAAEVALLDEEEATGQIAAVGDEAAFIRRIEANSFQGLDLVFFAGHPEHTKKHWMAARKAGASVIDMTNALAAEPGVVIRSPWIGGKQLGLTTTTVIPANLISVILGLVASRCAGMSLTEMAATVLLPASERGQAGMDEMHQQTVKLLSFQSLPREEFDAQVTFNLLPALGPAAKIPLQETAEHIHRDYIGLGAHPQLAVQIIQAPVFHGYGISLLLNSERVMTAAEIQAAITGDHVTVALEENDPPSNLSAAGHGTILVRVNQADDKRVWLWMVADNIKLAALHGIACAAELLTLRPSGKVQ